MNMKKLAAAMLLALGAAGAQAATYSLGTLGTASGTYNVTGTFEDIFNFTISSPNTRFTGTVTNLFQQETLTIDGQSVLIDKYDIKDLKAFLYPSGDINFSLWPSGNLSMTSVLTPGDYSLKITGEGVAGDSRQGQYSLFTQAVPEPESYAMFLAGLGLMGAIARRRRVQ